MKHGFLVCSFALVLFGCSGIKVSDYQRKPLPGIPFYVKSPRLVQETRLAGDRIGVQFEIEIRKNGIATTETLPGDGPVLLAPSAASEEALQRAQRQFKQLDGTLGSDVVVVQLDGILSGLRALDPLSAPDEVVSNTRKYEMVAGPEIHYVKSRIPFMGSASAQFQFASDGTLTNLQSESKEETASTILSLIPFTAALTKQWDLTTPDSTAKFNAMAETSQLIDQMVLLQPTPVQPVTTKITMKVTRTPLVYTLRKVDAVHKPQHVSSGRGTRRVLVPAEPPLNVPPLRLADALSGANGVELVSIESAATGGPAEKVTPAYTFSGQVVPPKSD